MSMLTWLLTFQKLSFLAIPTPLYCLASVRQDASSLTRKSKTSSILYFINNSMGGRWLASGGITYRLRVYLCRSGSQSSTMKLWEKALINIFQRRGLFLSNSVR